jgi:hypothetical protein
MFKEGFKDYTFFSSRAMHLKRGPLHPGSRNLEVVTT